MKEITPLIRIALYVLAGWLAGRGLPPQAVAIITGDPAIAGLVTEVLAALMFAVAALWWRLAKRFGWAT